MKYLSTAVAQFSYGVSWPVASGSIAVLIAAIAAVAYFISRLLRKCWNVLRERTARKKREEERGQKSQRFDLALNNMSEGLVMFDACEQVVLWNNRYLEISGLPPEFMRPGRTLREILQARQKRGSFSREIEAYRTELLSDIARGITKNLVFKTSDGRTCRVANVPTPDGGWIATHEDTTDQVRTQGVIEAQKLHLDAAITNMRQGLCMFDSSQRLIGCNRQYADLYRLPAHLTQPGTPLRAILEYWIAANGLADDHTEYVENQIKAVLQQKPYQILNHTKDGRHISVFHRHMADGGWVSTHDDVTEATQREESFRLLFERNPLPMWVADRESLRFLAVNEAVVERYGYSREQFMEMTLPDLRPPEDRESFAAFMRALPAEDIGGRTGQHRISDGTMIDIEVYSQPLIYDGHPARMTVINDITNAKRSSDELRRTKKFLDAVIEHVPVPLVVRGVTGLKADARNARFSLFNRAYEELTGSARADLIGKTAYEIYPTDRADMVVNADDEALQSGQVVEIPEHIILTKGNEKRLVTGKKTVIKDDDGTPQYLLTVLDDVTERRRAEERIAYLAHTDSLTDLPNRGTFVDYLDRTLEDISKSGGQFAILCVDLDRFKEANDIYGHLVGDALLREAARRLHAAADGQFVARVGGDEFTFILTNGAYPEDAEAVSERLLAAFQAPFEVENQRLQIGLSIGGAVYPEDGTDAKMLIANADAALYQAKSEARGSLQLFDAELAARLHDRRDLKKELQAASTRNEFFLHYQPQEKIRTRETTGFEALVRWQSPNRGQVPPGDFISIAEESGLIVPLGNWILREACREAASWPEPLKIAVNISPVQFHAGDLAEQVHLILLETGLAPSRLELEITEGVLIDDFGRAVSILRKLKSLGVQIAMDDFGSGYSSLSYLHAFAFDKIKIDRSFIGDLERNHHSKAIVRAIITLGHSLNVPVLAEGVETEIQRRFLAQAGCDDAQGYLMGRPQPIEVYAKLVGRAEGADSPADAYKRAGQAAT